jgi:hypothetical protein
LRDEQQPAPVEAVGRAARPGREKQDRRELGERQDTEQELRSGEPEDEDRGGEVLEPGSARRQGVAEEVRAESPRPDEGQRGTRADLRRLRPLRARGLGYARPALCSAA